jgi:2'-5' RNA ligase
MRRPEPRGVRSFVAVLLPEALRVRLAAAIDELRAGARRVAWVPVQNLHVTLRFLGAVDEATLQRVREALEAGTVAIAPFAVRVGGLGGFPPGRAPRVIWAGVTGGAEALCALSARLETALAERGIPPEGRPFHPHVTLGRARDPRGVPELAGRLAAARDEFGETVVDAVHLMRSDLDPAGARYGVLARAALGARVTEPGAR